MSVHPEDFLIEAGQAGLVLLHQQRIITAFPISWDSELDCPSIALERFEGRPIAVIGAGFFCPLILLVAQMRG